VLSFLFALARGRLTWRTWSKACASRRAPPRCLYVILIGAFVFSYFITLARIPEALVQAIQGLPLSPLAIVFVLLAGYLVLGAVFDEISAMLITLPFVLPVIVKLALRPGVVGIINGW